MQKDPEGQETPKQLLPGEDCSSVVLEMILLNLGHKLEYDTVQLQLSNELSRREGRKVEAGLAADGRCAAGCSAAN